MVHSQPTTLVVTEGTSHVTTSNAALCDMLNIRIQKCFTRVVKFNRKIHRILVL